VQALEGTAASWAFARWAPPSHGGNAWVAMNGKARAATRGNGPVDALFNAIRKLVPHDDAVLNLYQVHAVTAGTDAQAEVSVVLAESGRTVRGTGAHTDTLVASARAYVNALNKLIVKRGKSALSAAG
jgi:2-isopropylmalate synthase